MRTIVIGSGLAGLATAYYLRRGGAEVVVLDRGNSAATETSFANGGLLTPSMSDPWNSPGFARRLLTEGLLSSSPVQIRIKALPSLPRWGWHFLRNASPELHFDATQRNVVLANYTLRLMRQFRAEERVGYDAGTSGTLKLFRDHRSLQTAWEWARRLQAQSVASQILDACETIRLEPALRAIVNRIAGSLYFPNDETGNAHTFACELVRILEAQGVEFRFATTVTGWNSAGSRLTGVRTTKSTLEADCFITAAGSFSAGLLRMLGIRIPTCPIKGYSISIPLNVMLTPPRLGVVDDSLHAAATPLGDILRVAGTAEFAGFDTSIRPKRIANLVELARSIYPQSAVGAANGADLRPWAGLRSMSADGVPILGRTGFDNLYLNIGHGHLGWSLALGAGSIVSAMALGETPVINSNLYALSRFS